MEQENKVGFFGQYVIALTKPSRYKELLNRKSSSRVFYVLLLALILFFLKTGIHFIGWDMSVGGIRNLIMNGLPSFTLQNGTLNVEYPVDMDFNNQLRIVIDSSVEKFETEDIEKYEVIKVQSSDTMDITSKYYDVFLISKTNVALKSGTRLFYLSFADLKDISLNNASLTNYLPVVRVFIGVSFFLSYLIEIGGYLLMAALYALIARMRIRGQSRPVVDFRMAFHLAIYAKTLFALLGAINASLGYPIYIEIQYIVATIVTIVFMMKAQIAIMKDQTDQSGPIDFQEGV